MEAEPKDWICDSCSKTATDLDVQVACACGATICQTCEESAEHLDCGILAAAEGDDDD